MKKFALLAITLFLGFNLFAQAKYQPGKVIVLILSEKNPTLDESKFPNCSFYYTPNIKAELKEMGSVSGAALGAMGINKEKDVYDMNFSGEPAAAYEFNMMGTTLFDKAGIITARYNKYDYIITSPKKNLQGTYDFTNYSAISKDYIKKGKTTKPEKKAPKKPKKFFDFCGMEIPNDFEVENASGEKFMIKDLVKGEALTFLHVMYLKPSYDFNAGFESGENKSGKQFINDAINTTSGIKKLEKIIQLESEIFGHKVNW